MYSNVARKYLKTNKKLKNDKLREQQDRYNVVIVAKVVGNGCFRHTSCLFRTGNACFLHRILHHLDHFCRSYDEWLDGEVLDISCHEVGVFFGKSHFVEYDVFRIWEIDAFS